jgi:hypothetical protein
MLAVRLAAAQLRRIPMSAADRVEIFGKDT